MIVGILLAAGHGRRFGSDKRLCDVLGRPLIDYSLQSALRARLSNLYVVLGPDDTFIRSTLEASLPNSRAASFVVNHEPRRGMMSSLKAALGELPASCSAAVVIHADMPLVPSALTDRLIVEYETRDEIVVPTYGGHWRHPRVIPRWLFDEFLSLADGEKGTPVLERHSDRMALIPIDDDDFFVDVDSLEDIERVTTILKQQAK